MMRLRELARDAGLNPRLERDWLRFLASGIEDVGLRIEEAVHRVRQEYSKELRAIKPLTAAAAR
jgi:hypothetical protein